MSKWGDKLLTESDNARLRAENDKLKYELELEKFRGAGEIEAYRRETSVAVKKASQAKAENDKLRELVEDMLSCIEIRAAFERPPTEDIYEQFAKRASKLGVEVD